MKTWPVLHYGPIPSFDGTNWDLEVSGEVEHPFTLTYQELRAMQDVTIDADMHCVTGLDDARQRSGRASALRALMERAKPTADGEVGDRAVRARLHVEPVARRP